MKKYILFFFGILLTMSVYAEAPPAASVRISDDMVFMQNSFVERAFDLKEDFITRSFVTRTAAKEYATAESREFCFDIDGRTLDGRAFRYRNASVEDVPGGKRLDVNLDAKDAAKGIGVTLSYWIFDDAPGIRKVMTIRNDTDRELKLENLDVESLRLIPSDTYMTNVYANYGTNITRIPYVGDYYDPAILLYNEILGEGIVLGNEAPGILKRTDCYTKDFHIGIGMKRSTDDYPFRKYLAPGETFTSPGAFILFSKQTKWQDCFEVELGDYVRKHAGVKLFERESYPLFYYCTWMPFKTEISSKLVRELADSLEGTGVEVLLIDDGWSDNWGDYNSHPERFPEGMEQTCRYITSKGMKPGMWFSIASINRDSEIYRQHPEWAVAAKDGKPGNVYCLDDFRVTMSMSSPWYDHILGKLRHYIRTCKLGYVKLDFAVACSAYITDKEISGDYAPKGGRDGYKDQASSYWSLYRSATRLFDDLKREFPELIVDCTFEVWGKYHIIDYALMQHADVDWLTNYEFPAPEGPVSIRQINAERARVVPVQTMMVGNQLIDCPMWQFTYKSLASGVQLMCGDPRNLTPEQRSWYKEWSDWFRGMDAKYQYTRYSYRSDIFDRPSMAGWDGCYRFNPDKQGGVLFFYRNRSLTHEMTFPVDKLIPGAKYRLYRPCGGEEVGIFTGADLATKGLRIVLDEPCSAEVIAIERIK